MPGNEKTQAVKQYLKKGEMVNNLIKSKLDEVNELRELATSVTGIDYSKNRTKGQGYTSEANFVHFITKIADIEKDLEEQAIKLISIKARISEFIAKLDNSKEQVLIRLKYIHFLSWEEISYEMDVSIRTVHRIHSSALLNLYELGILEGGDIECEE